MIIIAIVNVILVLKIFYSNKQREQTIYENNRKIDLFKKLILDYNLHYLYDFFKDILEEVKCLSRKNITIEEKKRINEKILYDFAKPLRLNFIDVVYVANENMQKNIQNIIDNLTDKLTDTILNSENKCLDEDIFKEHIIKPISTAKIEIISILFKYNGN
jgi:hypothetical protein